MKQYVIHIPSSKISVKNAQEVIDSAKEIGKIDVELWEGQHRDGAFRKMYEKNMRLHRMEEWENYSYLDCIVGCFMSHFSLWEESVRTNERIMILEHDAIFVNEYKDYYWDGIVNIGRPLWGNWFLKDKKVKNAFGENKGHGEREHIEDGFYKREIDKWVEKLNPQDPRYRNHQLEAIWAYRNLDLTNIPRVRGVLKSDNHYARAAAAKQLRN